MDRAYSLLLFILPFLFFPYTSEIFEINKITVLYLFAGVILLTTNFIALKTNTKSSVKINIFNLALAFFVLAGMITTCFSVDLKTSIWGYYSRFNGGLLSIFAYFILVVVYTNSFKHKDSLKHIKILLITAFLLSAIAILEHFNISLTCMLLSEKINNSCWSQDTSSRVFATFGQPNWLAAYLSAILPLSLIPFIKNNNYKYFILPNLTFLAIIFTRSRSGLLSLGVSYLIFTLFTFYRTKTKYITKIFTLLIFFLVIYFFTKPQATVNKNPYINITPSTQIRFLVWKGAWDIFTHNPILGTGPETFAYSYWKYRPEEHNTTSEWDYTYNKAHNDYLHILATEGLVGFTAYMGVILVALYFLIPRYKDKYYFTKLGLLSGYISLLVSQFFGFLTVNTSLLFFLYPAFAMNLSRPNILKRMKLPRAYAHGFWSRGINLIIIFISFIFILTVTRFWIADVLYKNAKRDNLESLKLAYSLHKEPLYLIKLANLQYENGHFLQESYQLIDDVVLQHPQNTRVLEMAFDFYMETGALDGNYIDAQNLNEKLKILMPTNAKLFYQEGFILAQKGQKDKAIESLLKAVHLKPNYEKARILLGLLYEEMGNHKKAQWEFQYVINNINPENRTAITRLK